MKIVSIFADKLYSFQYSAKKSELRRILELWNDPNYLFQFISENKHDLDNKSVETLVGQILEDAQAIDELLYSLSYDKVKSLDRFFKPLDNSEYKIRVLSKQKGRRNYLRIYALRIDKNCFVITGGAIKFTRLMEERAHTDKERTKLSRCKNFLEENGVFDSESFYGFLCEQV